MSGKLPKIKEAHPTIVWGFGSPVGLLSSRVVSFIKRKFVMLMLVGYRGFLIAMPLQN